MYIFAPFLAPSPFAATDEVTDEQVAYELTQRQMRLQGWQETFDKNYQLGDGQRVINGAQVKSAARLARKFGHLWPNLFAGQIAALADDELVNISSLEAACAAYDALGIGAPCVNRTGRVDHTSMSNRFGWLVNTDGTGTAWVSRPTGSVFTVEFDAAGLTDGYFGGEEILRRHVDCAIDLLVCFLPLEAAEQFVREHLVLAPEDEDYQAHPERQMVPVVTRRSVVVVREVNAGFFGDADWRVTSTSLAAIRSGGGDLVLEFDDFVCTPEVAAELQAALAARWVGPERAIDRLMSRRFLPLAESRLPHMYGVHSLVLLRPDSVRLPNRPGAPA